MTFVENPRRASNADADSIRDLVFSVLREYRLEPDPEALWQEARPQVRLGDGLLVLDDSTWDKPYARTMGLVSWHWSGNHHAVVKGINLLTLVWTSSSSA